MKCSLLSWRFGGLAALFWAAPAWADGPHTVKGPYLTGLSSTGVDVRFELDGNGPASVEVRRQGGDGGAPHRSFADPAATAMHVVHITGLEPSAVYVYDVRAGGALLGSGRFSSAPPPDSAGPTTFLVYGDDRTDPVAHSAIVHSILATPSDFLVNTGDLVEDGGKPSDWQTFFDIEGPLLRDRPLFLAIGNHELYDDAAGANFARYFGFTADDGTTKPYGTARVGPIRFFFLNGMHEWDTGEERQWLEGALARADTEAGLRFRVAVVHHGPVSSGPHGPNPKLVNAHVPELLASHHIDVLFSGHDHIYERGELLLGSGSLKYVVSGGGGAPLYRIVHPVASGTKAESTYHFIELTAGEDALRTIVHRGDGSLIERCVLRHAQPWDCTMGAPPAADPATPAPAVASAPPPSAPPESNGGKCGCSIPGTGGPAAAAGVALAVALAGVFRRKRRRS